MHADAAAKPRAVPARGVSFGIVAFLALVIGHGRAAATDDPLLHVPSPDWRDQVVYFVMIDRFDDGEPGNNDQGAGEFDPSSNAKYSGGDLRGIARRIDYIRGLGATAVWITPPVANQWWNPLSRYGGYHGYWAEDFMRVDAHYGTLQDYRELSRQLHAAGMYLVQDVVVNHTADYFGYDGGRNRDDPAAHFKLHPDARGRTAPTQWPFNLNDARNPQHRAAGIYHWTPAITDYNDPEQEATFQLAGLDDLDTGNPVVREALRKSYGYWIREVGVDGFRVDTAFYVAPEFFTDFLRADDARHAGILRVAKQTGRDDFHVFGEGFTIDKPHADIQARRIDGYMRGKDGKPLLPGMINFPLYGTAVDVFARGRPSADLGHRIGNMMEVHAHPQLMPSFIDNHDVDRFLAGGSDAGLKQGLLMLMTLPGIPVIYYGTEQGFTEQRGAMFAKGYGSGGRDRFDTDAPLYRYIQRATTLRRENPVLSRGTPTVLAQDAAGPGVLAWRMDAGDETALVVFNTADREALLDNLDTGLAPGTVLAGVFGIDATPDELTVGADGRMHRLLPARSGLVWRATDRVGTPPAGRASLTLDPLPAVRTSGDFKVTGNARRAREFKLVVDGDVANAQTVRPDAGGHWQATVGTGNMVDPDAAHRVVAWSPPSEDTPAVVSPRRSFHVTQAWKVLADVDDPAGDDTGSKGTYRYPADPGWGAHRQLDLRHLRVSGAGGALKIELRMHDVTATWNPANGFDHVAFTVFVQVPGRDGGSRVMPLQNATLPEGMQWHYRLRTHGWTNALFSAAGASA
ncbi:MAG TPA: alpha-amylase family glycosyl hydrolase, partial [Gemmatimonadaceae bacterium]|nr:alpha-amylase family glycosyl hydrolase [Gemmatimonadaceae bacterium]